jgi:acyl-CoA thioesterase FadM
MGAQIIAVDWGLGDEGLRHLRQAGMKEPVFVVTRVLRMSFTQPLLDGDHLYVHGELTDVGTTSLLLSSRQTAFRKGTTVSIGEAQAVMVAYDTAAKVSVEHRVPSPSPEMPEILEWDGLDLQTFQTGFDPTLRVRVGAEHQNPLGAMFGATTADMALHTAVMHAERMIFTENKLPTAEQRQQRFVPRFIEVEYLRPGQPNATLLGFAQLMETRQKSLHIGVQLMQEVDGELVAIARARLALCLVSEIDDSFFGWRWKTESIPL